MMSWLFKETSHAQLYLKYRPIYPPSIHDAILSYLAEGEGVADGAGGDRHRPRLALDVGCGSGQNTLALARRCDAVVGVDSSEAQVDAARQASVDVPNVTFCAALGHELSFQADASVDLVTVAQALHWFDKDRFYAECKRILRKGGVLAAYGYGAGELSNKTANADYQKLIHETLHDYMEPNINLKIGEMYREIYVGFTKAFPDSKWVDTLNIEMDFSVQDFIGYVSSFSFYQKFKTQNPLEPDPLEAMFHRFEKIFEGGAAEKPIHCNFQVFMLLGRNS